MARRRIAQPQRSHHEQLALGVSICLLLAVGTGCSAGRTKVSVATVALTDIMPMGDRDHYVYFWQRIVEGEREAEGIQVEHITALPDANQYEINISEDGLVSGRLRFYHDGSRVMLLSEEDVESGLQRTYDPPLVHLTAPLRFGETGMRSTAIVTQVDDGSQIAKVDISQRLRISETSDVVSALGTFDSGLVVEARRTVHTPAGDIELLSAAVLVPGIGEIRSEGTTLTSEDFRPDGTPEIHTVLRRELACALIGKRTLGNCREVEDAIAAQRGQQP